MTNYNNPPGVLYALMDLLQVADFYLRCRAAVGDAPGARGKRVLLVGGCSVGPPRHMSERWLMEAGWGKEPGLLRRSASSLAI